MKLQKLLLVVAAMGAMATGCSKEDPGDKPEPPTPQEPEYTGPDRYHDMPKITQQQSVDLVMEFKNQLTNKLLMATLTYNCHMVDETMDEERHFGADYSGHLDESPYSLGFTFEYVEGSFSYYDHSEEIGEYYAGIYESDIGGGFSKILQTTPSRAAPTLTYTYYYDGTYLCVFGEGTIAGYDDVFYEGFKVDKNGITLEYYRITDYADEISSYDEEFTVAYYEEE